jgi:hypothetical protein
VRAVEGYKAKKREKHGIDKERHVLPGVRAYGSAEESFSLAFPALVLQRALRAFGTVPGYYQPSRSSGTGRGTSMQRRPLRRL